MVAAGTIGYRTASGGRLMNYDEFFADAIGRQTAPVAAMSPALRPRCFTENGLCRPPAVRLGRLRFTMAALAAALPGTTSARARWSTLAYVEKVRPQFLSLRQHF